MSLLLDARKKILGSHASASESSSELHLQATSERADSRSTVVARDTGKNLFAAKSSVADKPPSINKNLLFALGGTVLLLGGGFGYLSSLDTDNNHLTVPRRTLSSVTEANNAPPPNEPVLPTEESVAPSLLVAEITAPTQSPDSPSAVARETAWPTTATQPPRVRSAVTSPKLVQAGQAASTDMVDPLLANAYQAYQNSDFDSAQKSYLAMLAKDSRNRDALLGLAAIAQQRDETGVSMQYYQRLLKINPRDPAANAALSSMDNEDGNTESRLKTLLREQPNAAPLHFALGNQYATESRWSEAQQAYFNAHSIAPDNPEFALNLAVSLDHLGQEKAALQYYQRALQLDHGHDLDRATINLRIQELSN